MAAMSSANAAVITISENLTIRESDPGTAQPDIQLCVIGEPSGACGTDLPTAGSPTEYTDIVSPEYSVATIKLSTEGSDFFSMGIDVNSTGDNMHTLTQFLMEVSTDGGMTWMQVAAFFTPTLLDPLLNTGTGDSDWQLDGFSLAGFDMDDLVRFTMSMTGASPGREQFFILAAEGDVPDVPLPAAAWLMLAGVGGLGFASRKKKAL